MSYDKLSLVYDIAELMGKKRERLTRAKVEALLKRFDERQLRVIRAKLMERVLAKLEQDVTFLRGA